MMINYINMGINTIEISACSLWVGGAMTILLGWIAMDSIWMMGHWYSDDVMRYLHIQAQPIISNYTFRMYNQRTCAFLPGEKVPIVDTYGDD
jgi:hypothetical protein